MKLEATAGDTLKAKLNSSLLWVVLLLFLFRNHASSQSLHLTFKENTPLGEALLESSRTFGFKVAFDAQRLQSVFANPEVSGNSIDEYLSSLLDHSGIYYDGYIIFPEKKD